MDARRFLTAASAGLWLGLALAEPAAGAGLRREIEPASARMDPIPNPSAPTTDRERPAEGRSAIAAANVRARTRSNAADFVGGLQVFDYAPGRIYEVWAAPLRVTTLTLSPGEALIAKAAGDTVRWQIGETTSGTGEAQRTHVLVKPLEQGLETNLVLTTSRRVYLVQLRSGKPDAFNPAVTWDEVATRPLRLDVDIASPAVATAEPPPVYGRYSVKPKGRRPHWTPSAVFDDGRRTYIAFPETLAVGEAPALFALSPDGESQMVNYRQQGGLFVADRVLDRAELRLGGKRAQVVRLTRQAEE
jgi:type IV secretion system protein VirB9